MRQTPAFPVCDAGHNIIGFVIEKSFGFVPSLRERMPVTFAGQGCGNKHKIMPSCPSLSIAVAAIKLAARHK